MTRHQIDPDGGGERRGQRDKRSVLHGRSASRSGRVARGLALIGAIALLASGIFFGDVVVRAQIEGPRISILAPSAEGLRPGAPVWVAGRAAGRVLSISFIPYDAAGERDEGRRPAGGHLLVRAVIDRVAEPVLRADATAEVRAPELLAPVIVAIDPGTGSKPPWRTSDTLRTAAAPPINPESVMALADTLLMAVRSLQARAAAARSTIASGRGSLRLMRENPEVVEGLRRNVSNFADIIQRDIPRSSLAMIATDSTIGAAAKRVRERVAMWDAPAQREERQRNLAAANEALTRMSARWTSLAERIGRGEGTAGRILMDGEIERQVALLRTRTSELEERLMLYPSRWLRIRVF